MLGRLPLLALFALVLLLSGAGCLVDEDDPPSLPEKVVISEYSHHIDLDGSGRPDITVGGNYVTPLGEEDMWSLDLRVFTDHFAFTKGNAIVNQGIYVEQADGWGFGDAAHLEKGVPIGYSINEDLQQGAAPSEKNLYWSHEGDLCAEADTTMDKTKCNGLFADQKGYMGLRIGRGDTARYGWALFKVDTTRVNKADIPYVILYDYAVRSKAGVSLETGERP